MISLELKNVCFRYTHNVQPLENLNLTINQGEHVAVLGESGVGKSSLLRIVAGLERVSGGEVFVGGELMSASSVHIAPEKRNVGMVFQDWAVFPHLSVAENIAFGLLCRGRSQGGKDRVDRLLATFELHEFAHRAPHTLSGGQLQRVACARALAPSPRILLLDEAFSSLDLGLRQRVRTQVFDALRSEGVTVLMVTHDPSEAFECAERVFELKGGEVQQVIRAAP
jgi:iron(III) transport system ATP-binding protein